MVLLNTSIAYNRNPLFLWANTGKGSDGTPQNYSFFLHTDFKNKRDNPSAI